MRNPLKWLEQKLFTGDVIHDYGPISEQKNGGGTFTHTLLLCRKHGRDVIVLRHTYRAIFGFSFSYTEIPAERAEKLAELFIDIAARGGSKPNSTQ